MLYDTIIIGAGPSGVTCAIYLKRAGLNPLVIYKDAGSLGLSKIENLYSYDSISGIDLFNKGLEQLKFNKIDTVKEEVLALTQELNFKAITKDNEYEGKTLVIASGLNKSNLPKMFKDYLGMGVSTCAFCDAPLFKKKRVWVAGKEPYLTQMIKELNYFTQDVVTLNVDEIESLSGEFGLQKVTLKNGEEISLNNLFIALPLGSQSISSNLGILIDDKGNIVVDENNKTNLSNVYACGDIIKGRRQVSKAMNDGMNAAYSIIEVLKSKK